MANPGASRPPRRIYVGGLPAGTTEAALRQFINEVMIRTSAVASAGFPISNCKVYSDKNYAFLEFRSVEEASNCMAFDGVVFNNTYLRIRRPNNYDYDVAVTLGFTEPNPVIDLNQLEIVRTVVQDSPNKLFIGGLPCEWNEDQVKEKLTPFGMLKAFNLVMDKVTGNSKGYAFCEYQYPEQRRWPDCPNDDGLGSVQCAAQTHVKLVEPGIAVGRADCMVTGGAFGTLPKQTQHPGQTTHTCGRR
ncbi:hypothetical protein WJX79_008751 [Trebouxia sp. C0005]